MKTKTPPLSQVTFIMLLMFIGMFHSNFANSSAIQSQRTPKLIPNSNDVFSDPNGNTPPPTVWPAIFTAVNVTCPYSSNNGSISIINLPWPGYNYSVVIGIATGTGYSYGSPITFSASSYTFSGLGIGNTILLQLTLALEIPIKVACTLRKIHNGLYTLRILDLVRRKEWM